MKFRDQVRALAGAVLSAWCDGLAMSMPVTFTETRS
ncbi:UNVERIFIED_ORG: hypothetical protein J2X79_004351 [Arthrobacter globiformis]|nr:hypothetical protein [Arthrobacter globiformis]